MRTATVILDRSGSMHSHWSDTIGAVNNYLATLAKDAPDTVAAVTVFDSVSIDELRNGPITDCKPLSTGEAVPRGYTPLFDAVGVTIAKMKALPMGTDDRRIVVIMTDGEENASRDWSLDRIKTLLDECKANNWLVIFLGTDPAVWAQGIKMGTSVNTSAQFASSAPQNVMRGAASAGMRYMSAPSASDGMCVAAFTQEERDLAANPKIVDPSSVFDNPTPFVAPITPPSSTSGKFGERQW